MEVFLRNLPVHLADRGLEKQLQPLMEQLSIKEYLVEKQRKTTTGRITFRREAEGAEFLRHYGEEPIHPTRSQAFQLRKPKHPPTQARLELMGRKVYCKPSDRKPDEIVLKTIEHEASQRTYDEADAEKPTKTLQATELSCGHHAFTHGRLTFNAEWTVTEPCHVKFARRCLIITLTRCKIQLRILYQSIVELLWRQNGSATVILYWAPTILELEHTGYELISSFLHNRKSAPSRQRLDAIDRDHARISPYCLVYHFLVPVPITGHVMNDFEVEMLRLTREELFPVTRYEFGFQQAAELPFADAAARLQNQLDQHHRANSLPFDLLFLLQALMTNGYLHPTTISALAQRLIQRFEAARKTGGPPPVSVDAFKKLFDWIDYPSPYGNPDMFEVDGIMAYLEESESLVREGASPRARIFEETQDRTRIFRVVVTPTSVLLHGPELEPMNRVLRKFPNHSYFIRAQFCDEAGNDLFFNSKVSLDRIYNRFKSILSDGIQIAGRVYKLLGFSHSSLRAHSAWLSAPFFHQNQRHGPDFIIETLGDFNDIRSPARRAARIGQAFSETPWALDLDEYGIQVSRIPDVERNGRVFSDGIGTISHDALSAVYKVIPKSKGFPTCLQIRWAGAKGMLALDPLLEGRRICIRDSMIKFASNDKQLEICDMASRPMPMVLNRQLIKILEDMKAPDEWFLNLQSTELQRLRGISASVYNTASFIRMQKVAESIRLHDFLRQTEAMGVDYRQDSFLRGAVEIILLRELRLLKHKSRIPVREGITLFGVMDETGFLKEGQVYVTFDTEEGRYAQPPEPGPLLVTRSPALHPGDWGSRDLPSQLSGGDLDGDVFHVIWDPEVVGALTTYQPADYGRTTPPELNRPVTLADIAAFFVDFMKTDQLGVIAIRHMILADQKEDGTRDQNCIALAELHSSAWRPDFLAPGPSITVHDKSNISLDDHVVQEDSDSEDEEGQPRYGYYKSERIIGQLYRAVDERKIWSKDIKMIIKARGPSFWDEMLAALKQRVSEIGPVEWRHRSNQALGILHAYEDAIHGVMVDLADQPHQPLTELEVFVGYIINKRGVQTPRQRDRSVKLKDEFEHIATWITHEMRNPPSVRGYTSELDALELCLACLCIGCEKRSRDTRPRPRSSARNLESFKVVAAATLIQELSALQKRRGIKEYLHDGGEILAARFQQAVDLTRV
ncbi:RNA dependent RNA polymerase-domain-containing protein [Thermothelomyces heterothallicus CBS 202.75]|uniref:RNA dependent RNA polymerase-domain-containing protein n=1 Tax=Thermothelomyces heterothallicus CBS 202.75 TaxID=1149848 RepID=UPI003744A223